MKAETTFRLNPQVIQMIAILFAALAIPLALVAMGVLKFSAKPRISDSLSESPGLRAALEQASEKSFPAPGGIPDGRGVYLLSACGAQASKIRNDIERSASSLQGSVLHAEPVKEGEERILVQIPANNAGVFESTALQGFTKASTGRPAEGSRLYELIFPAP
ncbi:MAG: hypothetical protein ACOYM3_04020 [Terrimicrobiaceae bacterium]